MKKYNKETAVGIFVLLGLLAMAYMSVKLGNVGIFQDDHYVLYANFTDISGLKESAPVQMYGVKIGYVKDISIDQKAGMAHIIMMIEDHIELTDDAIASVKTTGLIGDKYIKISPGGVGGPVQPGDTLFDTEPAIDLEDLISKFAFGKV